MCVIIYISVSITMMENTWPGLRMNVWSTGGSSSGSGGLKPSSSSKPLVSASAVGPYPPHYPPPHHPPAGPHVDVLGYPPALNGYPARPPLQQLYDPHGSMRAPLGPLGVPGGKP